MTAATHRARAIVALDVPTLSQAMTLVETLGPACDFYKVGSELFTAAGPDAVAALRDRGREVFLDLKFHDIPATVRGAVRSAARLGTALVTVHASGGADMVRAAVDEAGAQCGVLAVTVLTSLHARALGETWGRDIGAVEDEVLRLADLARAAGAHGIVCSVSDVPVVRAAHGDALRLLVPGIRLEGQPLHDQARAATPREAVAAGATYLVLGRAVTGAADPRSVMRQVMDILQ